MTTITSDTRPEPDSVSTWLTFLLALSCGLIAANIYYAQPLAGPIAAELGLRPQSAGLIVTMTQIGYGVGLLLIVPLGDLIENRRLITSVIVLAAVALVAAALSTHPLPFLAAALSVGVGSVAVQILLPYAGHLAPERIRGQVVGNVASGLLLGIMLARPVSSFVASVSSWHAVYWMSSAIMAALAILLRWTLPPRIPQGRLGYGELMRSMVRLARTTPILWRRALYQASLFAGFSLFWTTVPLVLAGPAFRLSQSGIAVFALMGVAGAISAPIAGRLADRGWTRPATAASMVLTSAGFALTLVVAPGSMLSLVLFVVAAIAIDFGVQANVVLGFRTLFLLGADSRSRLNGLYMATFFLAGALGSAVGGWAYVSGGWLLAAAIGGVLPLFALIYLATEKK
ncbi:MFS transporter [Bradyrhizobium sp. LTSPM299]|jgi:predicted MFS family arabinose efflux permease|uniref:MFS transporter n=1 Tax=Bradyrhizobium sp. LTSPM299 TaxID=1619233 RepID=UPI0005C9A566|nr:MFS transporter [Bradyrhizobium sp. LTSPM299]KJC57255.1 MFS transporter [Bradyrhizobium sp. LTSPM299]